MYSKDEKIEILHFYERGNSLRNVRDLFSAKYPDRPIPAISTISAIIKKINSEGCLVDNHVKSAKMAHVITEELELNVLCYMEENPVTPLSKIAQLFNISKSSAHVILKKYKYKAYKFSNHQELFPLDKIKRVDFCETLFNLLNENEDLVYKILFTDEASFSINGSVNSQNYRYWSRTNRHIQNLTHTQYCAKVNVWAGIIGNVLVGPYFIEGNLNSNIFLELLRNTVVPQIRNMNIVDPWFQMDGAPAHSTAAIIAFLNENFPGRWIGRFSTIPWPARSPDLSPNDFFLWGYLKSKIYNNIVIPNIEELRIRIHTACEELRANPHFLTNSVNEFRNRLAYCLECEGGHFEHLLRR